MLHLMAGWWGFMIMLVPNSTQEKHTWATKLIACAKKKQQRVFHVNFVSDRAVQRGGHVSAWAVALTPNELVY